MKLLTLLGVLMTIGGAALTDAYPKFNDTGGSMAMIGCCLFLFCGVRSLADLTDKQH